MAKNHTNNNSKGVYGEIKNPFSISPFQSIRHTNAVSMLSTGHAAEKAAKTTQMPEITKQEGNATSKNEHAKSLNLAQEGQLKPRVDRAPAAKVVVSNGNVTKSELATGEVDDRCSENITRVRKNMRTGSELDNGSTATTVTTARRDSFNDRVSSFLNRARIKIRTTSDVGDTKSR